MKSSRQRFAEFREKVRKGLLDPVRFSDPSRTQDRVETGGKHSAAAGKHIFKRKKMQLFAEYRVMLRGYGRPMIVLLTVIALSTITTMAMPAVLQLLIDYVARGKGLSDSPNLVRLGIARWLPSDPWSSLAALSWVMVAISLLTIVFDWMKLLATQRVNFRLAGTLRQRLHNHLIRLPLSLLSDYKTGGIASRIMSDVDQVVGGISNAILVPFGTFLRVGIAVFTLFFISWKLALCITVLIPPILAIHMVLFRRLRPMWRNIQDDRSLLTARITDMYGGIRVVRSFRRERSELKEFGGFQDTMIRKQQYTGVLGRLLGTGWGVFGPAIGVVIIWYGGSMVLTTHLVNGKPVPEMTIGDLVMFQSYIFMLLGPVTQMIDSIQNLQQNLGALDRVIDVLEQKADMPDHPDARSTQGVAGNIELCDAHFGYSAERQVLKGISLNVAAGRTVAIVGPSGSGKTTLVNLIARFFDVKSGAILLDGVDIRDFRMEEYRELFAMVLQDVYLFDGTVLDNIAYGRRHATREEIIEAATQANAHQFIMEMPEAYQTIVGERGSKLSGGQKQRISIARAILADPQILILDEATSSLDTHSEQLIQESLKTLMTNRTTFVIAHRLSTIMHADCIVVLVDGKIVERGTHEELLEQRGAYHEMFTQQFQKHRDPTTERIDWEMAEDSTK